MSPSALARQTIAHPVSLSVLQHDLSTNAVIVEYVLAERASYAFAITHDSASAYPLPSKALIEADANRYRKELRHKRGPAARTIAFDPKEFRSFDDGYAVTSHSAQGLTTGRVLVNIDTDGPRGLVNSRLAYVAVSRAAHEAQIYTNDARGLAAALSTKYSKTSAVEFGHVFRTKEPHQQTPEQYKSETAAVKQTPSQQPSPGLGLGL